MNRYVFSSVPFPCVLQVAIKIIDKTQLNPTSLQKVSFSFFFKNEPLVCLLVWGLGFRFILSCLPPPPLPQKGQEGESSWWREGERERAYGMWCCLAGARNWMGARGDLCFRDDLSALSELIAALRGEWLISETAVNQPVFSSFCVCVCVFLICSCLKCMVVHNKENSTDIDIVSLLKVDFIPVAMLSSGLSVSSLDYGHLRFVVHGGQGRIDTWLWFRDWIH